MIIIEEIPFALLLTGVALLGLWWANYFYDHRIEHWRSRKVSHFFGGVVFLLCALLFSSFIWPIILTGAFSLILGGARFVRPTTFRGTGGTGRATQALSEVWFPLVAVLIFSVGWGIFNKPIESAVFLLMMAWGDCIGGWIRAFKYNKPTKGWEGSLATLGTCMLLAWAFLEPLWLGLLAALAATIAEYITGDVSKVKFLRWLDDNLTMPLISASVYFGGLYALGQM